MVEKKVKIGKSMVSEPEYRDFFVRYETKKDTIKPKDADEILKKLKKNGFKVKYKTVSFVDLGYGHAITFKAIKIKEGKSTKPYDLDIMNDWLKW